MNVADYQHLLAEKKFLQDQLSSLPDSARFTRISTESRLNAIEEKISSAKVVRPSQAQVRLIFNGRPVFGTHGIFAEFGAKAVSAFSEAVTTVAASLTQDLAAVGPLPNGDQNKLLITNISRGSFGFDLEEVSTKSSLFPGFSEGPSPLAQAIEQTWTIFDRSLLGSDDQLAETLSETNRRALDKVRTFLQTLSDNDATCMVQYAGRSVGFINVDQVKESLNRLGTENLREETISLRGFFQGVLPDNRTFEFKLSDTEEVIRGKIGKSIISPEGFNHHLYIPAEIRVVKTQVGSGRPRYELIESPNWDENDLNPIS